MERRVAEPDSLHPDPVTLSGTGTGGNPTLSPAQEPGKSLFRCIHQRGIHDQLPDPGRRQLELEFPERPLAHGHQPACAGVLRGRLLGDAPEPVRMEPDLDPYARKARSYWRSRLLSLSRITWYRSSAVSPLQATRTGKRPMNSGSKPNSMKSWVVASAIRRDAGTPSTAAPRRRRTTLSNPANAPLDDEQDVAGVDGMFARPGHSGRRRLVRGHHRHVGVLHQLQQVGSLRRPLTSRVPASRPAILSISSR